MSVIKILKNFVPISLKNVLREIIGINAVYRHIYNLEFQVEELKRKLYDVESFLKALAPHDKLWEISRQRWRNVHPTADLTWAKQLSGDAFIKKVAAYTALNASTKIIEIGPGYGRLLKSIQDNELEFQKYVGVDISQENVRYLTETFKADNLEIRWGDVETIELQTHFDIVISSLTFKHLYPTFEKALQNLTAFANPNCLFFFDLLEGTQQYFEPDRVTYIRFYTKTEIQAILDRIPLQLVSFDEVQHNKDHIRLLVVARKGV